MDDIIEIVFEVLIEGAFELMKSKKTPLVLRLIIYLLYSVFLLGISGILLWYSFHEASKLFAILLLLLSIVVLILFIYMTKVLLEK